MHLLYVKHALFNLHSDHLGAEEAHSYPKAL
jgi:hypothetical protein